MEEENKERRRYPRHVKLSLVQANSFVIGQTLNLSRGGAQIEVHDELPRGSLVKLDLAAGDQVLELAARVVYIKQRGTSDFVVGLEFEGLSEEQKQAVEKFASPEPSSD